MSDSIHQPKKKTDQFHPPLTLSLEAPGLESVPCAQLARMIKSRGDVSEGQRRGACKGFPFQGHDNQLTQLTSSDMTSVNADFSGFPCFREGLRRDASKRQKKGVGRLPHIKGASCGGSRAVRRCEGAVRWRRTYKNTDNLPFEGRDLQHTS